MGPVLKIGVGFRVAVRSAGGPCSVSDFTWKKRSLGGLSRCPACCAWALSCHACPCVDSDPLSHVCFRSMPGCLFFTLFLACYICITYVRVGSETLLSANLVIDDIPAFSKASVSAVSSRNDVLDYVNAFASASAQFDPLSKMHLKDPISQMLLVGPVQFRRPRALAAGHLKLHAAEWSMSAWVRVLKPASVRNIMKQTEVDLLGVERTCFGWSYPPRLYWGETVYKHARHIENATLILHNTSAMHLLSVSYNLKEKWAQFGLDGNTFPRITSSSSPPFPSQLVDTCASPRASIVVGGDGVELAALQVHSHAISASEFNEMYRLGASIGELSRGPSAARLQDDTFNVADLLVTDPKPDEETATNAVNFVDNEMTIIEDEQFFAIEDVIKPPPTAKTAFTLKATQCIPGSRCIIKLKDWNHVTAELGVDNRVVAVPVPDSFVDTVDAETISSKICKPRGGLGANAQLDLRRPSTSSLKHIIRNAEAGDACPEHYEGRPDSHACVPSTAGNTLSATFMDKKTYGHNVSTLRPGWTRYAYVGHCTGNNVNETHLPLECSLDGCFDACERDPVCRFAAFDVLGCCLLYSHCKRVREGETDRQVTYRFTPRQLDTFGERSARPL